MEYGTLTYKVALSQSKLNGLCNAAMEKALAKDDIEVNGVEVKLNYDISKDLKLKCKTELVDHQWIEKPELELGALNIPVETLMNLVLGHYESVLVAKVDNAINENTNLLPFVYQGIQSLEEQINAVMPVSQVVDIKLGNMGNMTPRTTGEYIWFNGQLELGLSVQDKGRVRNDMLPTVSWISELANSESIYADIELSYEDVKALLIEKLSGVEIGGKQMEITAINIRKNESLNINMDLASPIKGKVILDADLVYNKMEGSIYAENLDVAVKPANFIYKITAPIVNKFIEGKLEEIFPIKLQELINTNLSKLPKEFKTEKGTISPKIQTLTVKELAATERGLAGKVAISGAELDLTIE